MATGYFKLYRPIRNHWVYSDSRYLHLWLDCLINARWSEEPKTEVYKGVMYTLNRGQFLFSRKSYADRLNIEEGVVRKAIDLMLKDEMVKVVGSLGKNKPTIYEVCNFDKYNPLNDSNSPSECVDNQGVRVFSTQSEPSENPVETQSKPSGNQVRTTKEESNKDKKEKKVKKEIIIKDFVPDVRLNQAIIDYVEFRKNIKRPMTDKAVSLMLTKLNKLSIDTNEQIEILNQSIVNGWQGIFPLKQDNQYGNKKQQTNNPFLKMLEEGTFEDE